MTRRPLVLIVMGVSASGKTTVGRMLAHRLGWPFKEGDELHTRQAIAKMKSGRALDDRDRAPWLARLSRWIDARRRARTGGVIACSVLKRSYRRGLVAGRPDVRLVYLRGRERLIAERARRRRGHFMPRSLLRSQFETLEEPLAEERPLVVDVDRPLHAVVADALRQVREAARRENFVLALNSGSSSLKFALFEGPAPLARGAIAAIGRGRGRIRVADGRGRTLVERSARFPDAVAALAWLLDWLDRSGFGDGIAAAGHRVVHGGTRFQEPRQVTAALRRALRGLVRLAPGHLPAALDVMRELARRRPAWRQVACFDTAFHRHLPPRSRLYPLPRRFARRGIVRYGFHGLSYASALDWLSARAGSRAARSRVIVAHLGSGVSCAAIRDGVSVDTTMGFTPTGGLPMATRSGDLDPGVLLYLMERERLTARDVDELVNRQGGLLGLSGSSADMQELLRRRRRDRRAALAVELFCYQVRKTIGAYAAAQGGLDRLVFTGGIGEHAASVRAGICAGLEFLGVRLDPAANRANAARVSARSSRVVVHVAPADEERIIAEAVRCKTKS